MSEENIRLQTELEAFKLLSKALLKQNRVVKVKLHTWLLHAESLHLNIECSESRIAEEKWQENLLCQDQRTWNREYTVENEKLQAFG